MKKDIPWLAPVLLIGILLFVWEGAVELFSIPLYVLPSPLQVLRALAKELPVLSLHGGVTVAEALAGMAVSMVLAAALGILMDCFPLVRRGLYPVLVVTQTVPDRKSVV